ncbi:MAG: hypothetical protein ACYC52_10160, partial [Coriobacteriia bacterium]
MMHWRKGNRLGRVFSAYVAMVLAVAIAGPGLAVYADEPAMPETPRVAEVVKPSEPDGPEVPAETPPAVEEPVAKPADEPVVEPEPEPVAPEPVVSEEVAPITVAPDVKPEPLASRTLREVVPAAPDVKPDTPGEAPLPGYYRIDPVPHGTSHYTLGSAEVTITVYFVDGEGWYMDFVSDTPVVSVKAKGSNDPNWYTYDPAVYSDTGLHAIIAGGSGMFAEFSHIDFKFGRIVQPEFGSVTVVKFHDLDEDGEMVDEDALDGWDFVLTLPGGGTVSGTSGDDGAGTVVFDGLEAGEYSLDELSQDGWHATGQLPIEFSLGEVEHITLYVGNVENPQALVTKTF